MKNMIFALSASALCACCAADGQLTIAERGRPSAYAVVVCEKPSECIRHAAEEFTNYVAKLTGVRLPIVARSAWGADRAGDVRHGVFIRSKGVKDVDAFRFSTEDRDFVIEGESDRAALFGVYDFLENQCGCEWLTATDEIVPARAAIAVPADFRQERRPAFVNRECGWRDVYDNPDFAAKLKLDGFRLGRAYGDRHGGKPPAFDSVLGICHTFQWILPASKYFKDHPEYFAEVDGVRKGEGRVQLCLSNPDVVAKAIEYVKGRIRKNYPAVKIYGVSQSDTFGYCTCANCKAIDEREGSPSGSIVTFVNKIAEAVEKEYPDVLIETLAYLYSRPAPKTLKCRDNVLITLCTDTCDLSRPLVGNRFRWRNQPPFAEDLAKWLKIARHVYIWDYALNFRIFWHAYPSLQVLKPNYEFFADQGVTHLYLEGDHLGRRAESAAIKLWLAAHLEWDPHQMVEPLMDRFLNGYYGAAAPLAKAYYADLAALQKDERKTPQMMWGTLYSPALTDAFFDQAAARWREALAAVKGDAVREEHVRWAMNCTDYTRLMRAQPERHAKSPKFAEFQAAAKRIVADIEGEKTWVETRIFGEDTEIDRTSKERLIRLATMDGAREAEKQAKGACEWRQKLLAFPAGRDFLGRDAFECNCPHEIVKEHLKLTCNNTCLRVKPFPYTPQKPFAGPATVVVQTDRSPKDATAVLRLKTRERGAKTIEFKAQWRIGCAFFDTDLDPAKEYVFESLDFCGSFKGLRAIVLEKVEGVYRTDEAAALAMTVRAGGRLQTLDWDAQEPAAAVLHNRLDRSLKATGVVEVKDFYGRAFKVPFAATIPAGGRHEVAIPRGAGQLDAKGVWRAIAHVTCADGSTCVREDRFAILDAHPVTAKIPYGSFRAGIHCHSARWLDEERDLTHDAAVRMGAKIVRIDDVFSQSATWHAAKKDYDFAKADRFLEGLERRGLAVNAIIQENGFKNFTEDFCTRLAQHYGERIDYYEIGNEWDLKPKESLLPEKAVAWQQLAYRGLKKGSAKARVATNGWAVEDSNGHANVTQKGFQETFMKAAKGAYDIHAMHLHFPFQNYVDRMGRFFKLRADCGVEAPFILNETALNVQYRGEEEVAENVWLKIIYGWAHGAKDYIWYNMRASQFDPGGTYGVVNREFRPRLTYAAFSGFTAALGEHDFTDVVVEKEGRKVYRFVRRAPPCGGRGAPALPAAGEIVIAGWDTGLLKPVEIAVRTDARKVWIADIMNNRRAVAVTDGEAKLVLSGAPQAWVFEGATFAQPEAAILSPTKAPPRVIHVSPVRPDYGWDMLLDKYAQVHEEYPADPATAHRTWKGKDDCSGIALFRLKDGRASLYISVKDEKDAPGDAVEVWRDGRNVTASLKFARTRHGDGRTTYEAPWPDLETCRINVRFLDDDGLGGPDGWIDYVPFDAKSPDPTNWPILRFE